MSWLEDALAGLQQGGAAPFGMAPAASPFPDIPQAATPEQEAAAAAAAREAAGAKLMHANQRRVNPFGMPDMNSAGVQLAMGDAPAGTGVPVNGSPSFQPMGIPPSLQLASTIAAPDQTPPPDALPPPGAVPMPQPRPAAADMGPTDVSAQSRAPVPGGPLPAPTPPMAASAAPPDAGPSFMDRMKSASPALLGVGAALQGDQGHLASALVKQRDDLVQQTHAQNLTANALIKAGAPAELVAASIKNPELLKATIGQYLGKDKFKVVKTGKDQYGNEKYQMMNEQDGTFKDIPGQSSATPGAPPELSDAQKNRVQAIIEGREQYPSASSRAPDAAMIREAVHTQDPTFDAVNFKARQETRTKFTKGKGADNLTAFNTAIGHLGSLASSVDKLNNSGFPAWNKYIANPVAEQFDSKYQSGLKDFQTARTAVADELTRAFRGSGGNVHDIIQWENAINAADSPAALKSAIRSAAELLNSRIAAVGDEYNRGMGTTKDPLELLNPKAASSFKKILEGDRAPSAPVTAGKTASGISWSIN